MPFKSSKLPLVGPERAGLAELQKWKKKQRGFDLEYSPRELNPKPIAPSAKLRIALFQRRGIR